MTMKFRKNSKISSLSRFDFQAFVRLWTAWTDQYSRDGQGPGSTAPACFFPGFREVIFPDSGK